MARDSHWVSRPLAGLSMNPFPIQEGLIIFLLDTHECTLPTCQVKVALPLLHRFESKCCEQASSLHSNTHCAPRTVKFKPGVVWLTLIRSLGKWGFHFPVTFQWTQHELPCSLPVHSQPQHAYVQRGVSWNFLIFLFSAPQGRVYHDWLQLHLHLCLSNFSVILPLPWESYFSPKPWAVIWFLTYIQDRHVKRTMPETHSIWISTRYSAILLRLFYITVNWLVASWMTTHEGF